MTEPEKLAGRIMVCRGRRSRSTSSASCGAILRAGGWRQYQSNGAVNGIPGLPAGAAQERAAGAADLHASRQERHRTRRGHLRSKEMGRAASGRSWRRGAARAQPEAVRGGRVAPAGDGALFWPIANSNSVCWDGGSHPDRRAVHAGLLPFLGGGQIRAGRRDRLDGQGTGQGVPELIPIGTRTVTRLRRCRRKWSKRPPRATAGSRDC